jgi:O-antigen/teichoic acid export membrane protein
VPQRSLSRSLVIVALAETMARLVPIITLGFAARTLGAAAFGQASLLISFVDVGLVITAFGYHYAYAAQVTKVGSLPASAAASASEGVVNKGEWERDLAHDIIVMRLVHALVAVGMLTAFLGLVTGYEDLLGSFLVLSPLLIIGALDLTHHFVQQRATARVSSATAFAKIALLALMLLAVRDEDDLLVYAALMLATNSVVHLYTFWVWCRYADPHAKTALNQDSAPRPAGQVRHRLTGLFKVSWPHGCAFMMLVLIDRLDWFIGNTVLSDQELGHYVGITKTLQSGAGLMTAAMAPFLSEFVLAKTPAELSRSTQLALSLGVGLGALALLAVGSFPELFFGLLLGGRFEVDTTVSMVSACGLLGYVVFYICGFQILQLRGGLKALLLIMAAGVGVACTPLLVPQATSHTLAWASALAKLCLGGASLWALPHYVHLNRAVLRALARGVFCAFAAALLLHLMNLEGFRQMASQNLAQLLNWAGGAAAFWPKALVFSLGLVGLALSVRQALHLAKPRDRSP